MTEWFVSSAVLAAALIALHYLLRGRIGPRVQYALWLLALIRLLVPVSIGKTALSVGNLLPQKQPATQSTVQTVLPSASAPAAASPKSASVPVSSTAPVQKAVNTAQLLRSIWLTGAALVGGWFVFCNLRCRRRLRAGNQQLRPAAKDCPEIRLTGNAGSPCLFGLFPPVIYVTPDCAQDPALLRHCIAHETAHYRHGDHLWAVLRGLCLALHWFDPFVWWAAVLSRTDAELACDEAAIRLLGEDARAEYGRSLIRMTCRTHVGPFSAATTMSGRGRQLNARIRAIVKKPRTTAPVLIAVLLLAALAAGCTMTGAKPQEQPAEPSAVQQPEAEPESAPEPEPDQLPDEQLASTVEPLDMMIAAKVDYAAGADALSQDAKDSFCAYLLRNRAALGQLGLFDAEAHWTAEALSAASFCLTLYAPEQENAADELLYRSETGLVTDTRFRVFAAACGDDAPEKVREYIFQCLLSSVSPLSPLDYLEAYLDGHYDELSAAGIWDYHTVWSMMLADRSLFLTISDLPDGGERIFVLDLDTNAVTPTELMVCKSAVGAYDPVRP